jgi:hypothetical protein
MDHPVADEFCEHHGPGAGAHAKNGVREGRCLVNATTTASI